MNKAFRSLLLSTVCASIALFSAANARGQRGLWYVQADAGGNITPNADLNNFFGPVAPGSQVKFNGGVRLGVESGYFFTDWFALEGELGLMANNIESISDADVVDATFSNVPFLVNAKFQCPRCGRLTPYIGGGLGGSFSILDSSQITLNGTTLNGTMTDVVFAYQGFAGLRYKINEAMGVGFEFRYFATTSPEWEPEVVIGTASDHLQFGRIQTYAFSLTFDWRF
jgi:opacity protein-like surface antigen